MDLDLEPADVRDRFREGIRHGISQNWVRETRQDIPQWPPLWSKALHWCWVHLQNRRDLDPQKVDDKMWILRAIAPLQCCLRDVQFASDIRAADLGFKKTYFGNLGWSDQVANTFGPIETLWDQFQRIYDTRNVEGSSDPIVLDIENLEIPTNPGGMGSNARSEPWRNENPLKPEPQHHSTPTNVQVEHRANRIGQVVRVHTVDKQYDLTIIVPTSIQPVDSSQVNTFWATLADNSKSLGRKCRLDPEKVEIVEIAMLWERFIDVEDNKLRFANPRNITYVRIRLRDQDYRNRLQQEFHRMPPRNDNQESRERGSAEEWGAKTAFIRLCSREKSGVLSSKIREKQREYINNMPPYLRQMQHLEQLVPERS